MSRDKREYNGLRSGPIPFGVGGVPNIGSMANREEQVKRAFQQEMLSIGREIFVRAASTWFADEDDYPNSDALRTLAEQSHLAAMSYFEGIGLIQRNPPEEPATEQPQA